MNKKSNIIYSVLIFLFAFSFKLGAVQAYITNVGEEAINTFSIAKAYTDTYRYVYRANNGTTTNLGEKTVTAFVGETINIDAPSITINNNYILDNITINGSGSYSIGDTYTQPNSNLTILYTYRNKSTFGVTFRGNNYTHTGGNNVTATEGEQFTTTVTPSNNYVITGATITMGNTTLVEGTDYTFTQNGNSYVISVSNVTAALTINVTTERDTCLGEGTEVMLWDGSTKKIEDVTYDDLLKVWNHDTGTYGYEYPAWIEKVGTTNHYTRVTFSDGSELKVIVDHRVFSKKHNRYVNINSGELKVGDKVVSLKDGVSYVSIVSMEEVDEEINYYNIITARYFNIIANGLLVTYELYDDVSSNYKGFDSEMKWKYQTPEEEMISYEDMINMFGYVDKYLYKTLKLYDFKYAVEQGFISQSELMTIIDQFMMNGDYRLETPVDSDGVRLWMVTTSDDDNPSDPIHRMRESSVFVVPNPENDENFLYWYNSSDNKYYQPGDMVEVDSSMYFQAIYGETEEKVEVEEQKEETVEEETTKEVVEPKVEETKKEEETVEDKETVEEEETQGETVETIEEEKDEGLTPIIGMEDNQQEESEE